MTDLMLELPKTVSDARGAFHARAMGRQRGDGRWEGWLEFVPADVDASVRYATPIETHQQDRVTMERWASGLTRVYAEGALARARMPRTAAQSASLVALQDIAEALNRLLPHLERAGETQIAADVKVLLARVGLRIARLSPHGVDRVVVARRKGRSMETNTRHAHGNAISAWEDEGGSLDRAHDSDARGEHRYPDLHQTAAEQKARQARDDLKRALGGRRLHRRRGGIPGRDGLTVR